MGDRSYCRAGAALWTAERGRARRDGRRVAAAADGSPDRRSGETAGDDADGPPHRRPLPRPAAEAPRPIAGMARPLRGAGALHRAGPHRGTPRPRRAGTRLRGFPAQGPAAPTIRAAQTGRRYPLGRARGGRPSPTCCSSNCRSYSGRPSQAYGQARARRPSAGRSDRSQRGRARQE